MTSLTKPGFFVSAIATTLTIQLVQNIGQVNTDHLLLLKQTNQQRRIVDAILGDQINRKLAFWITNNSNGR